MFYIQSWQYFRSIVCNDFGKFQEEEECVSSHQCIPGVWEWQLGKPTSGGEVLGVPPPHQGQHTDEQGTQQDAHLLPQATTRVQISGSRSGDTVKHLWPSNSAGLRSGVSDEFSHQPLCSRSEPDSRPTRPAAGRFLTSQHRPARGDSDRNALMDVSFCFVLFSKENYIDERFYL